jgi:hypothetical protein
VGGALGVSKVTAPPVAKVRIASPPGDAATGLLMLIVTLAVTVRFTTATIPFEMTVEFNPYTRHVYAPEASAHMTVFPALVAVGPGLTDIELTFAAG